jgi:hypothetical protein
MLRPNHAWPQHLGHRQPDGSSMVLAWGAAVYFRIEISNQATLDNPQGGDGIDEADLIVDWASEAIKRRSRFSSSGFSAGRKGRGRFQGIGNQFGAGLRSARNQWEH